MSDAVLLTVNAGSSSIKLGVFGLRSGMPHRLGTATVDLRHTPLKLTVTYDAARAESSLKTASTDPIERIMDEALAVLSARYPMDQLAGIGHRVVHGGDIFAEAVAITDDSLSAIERLTPLAPMHQPHSVAIIKAFRALRPQVAQSASFDTAFHRSLSDRIRRLPLPREFFDAGLKRYGFHGLSFKYIAGRLPDVAPTASHSHVVVAHLGSGASLCALENGISRDTSMGYSTLDGIPMATRPGTLDPGVILDLLKQRSMTPDAIEDLFYYRSGLLGMSGISADTRELLQSEAPEAREALDIFTFRIAQQIAGMATTLGGLRTLVFTAGIGEHQPPIRSAVCAHLQWLGVVLDGEANATNAVRIDHADGKVAVLVVPTDEEQVIAEETCMILRGRA